MEKLHLEVVTPANIMVSQDVDIVVAPGSIGEFGVLKGHARFLSGIVPGELRFTADNKTEYFAVTSGFAEISDDKVSILVDAAERAEEIDIERAKKAMDRASERLTKERGTVDIDFLRAEASLKRAMMRIKVAQKIK
ncbi:ATP synthase epsilon chain [uncultured Desulfobacterium sp.]|uniref:ATP synthase epsilon chain n=1 Tax=uncultured Desulfobacterium sp. TaxID=201089 RepID=A0A445MZR9_9BACT|nr:ATP synthase epsilon chain [uncultured Desulfobacterium sp.]